MKLLLDSHVLLWWADGSTRLGTQAKKLIGADDTELFASAASWWEMAIKRSHGRLNVDLTALASALRIRNARLIAISFAHAEAAAKLPPHHGDPFDRMLIAQAGIEGLRLLTRDRQLKAYGSVVLFV